MSGQAPVANSAARLLRSRSDVVLHQALYVAASLGIADMLEQGVHSTADLARHLSVHEDALYRTLRALAGHGIFEETSPRTFRNTPHSQPLRSDVSDTVRPLFLFFGSDFYARPLSEILYSVRTGRPSRQMLLGMETFDYLAENPEVAKIFDDAMTALSNLLGPAVASSYDFSTWESLMDIGGGNGVLLSHILRAHKNLRGVLADLPHVLDRAGQRNFFSGDLSSRATLQNCDFFREIPAGCRAYLMKSVIHDWDDDRALQILSNCRRVIPANGALLLVELGVSEPNEASNGKLIDLVMLVLTGGKERTTEEYAALLQRAGFRLQRVVPTGTDFVIIECIPD
jgi:O-methyltransferase domain